MQAIHQDIGGLDISLETYSNGTHVIRSGRSYVAPEARLFDWLEEWAAKKPEDTFLFERSSHADTKWRGIAYREMLQRAKSVAAAIAGMGLGPDRPILILSGNSIEHQVLAFAAMMAGIPYAPVSVAYSTIEDALPKLRFVIDLLGPGLVYAADGMAFGRAMSIDEMVGRIIVLGQNAEAVRGAVKFSTLEAGGSVAALEARQASLSADAVAKFIFTSGTTGAPKAVMITHRMMCSDIDAIAHCVPALSSGPVTAIDWLPWSHVYGGSFGVNSVLRSGGSLYIDDGRPLPGEYSRTIENLANISPTIFWNVPKAFEYLSKALIESPSLQRSFFSKLHVMIYGAASLPSNILQSMQELARSQSDRVIPMLPAWGLTETSTIATVATQLSHIAGAIGVPVPGHTLKLVPNGDKYEARIKGPIVTRGYWKAPVATKAAFDDEGYFKTGDALRLLDPQNPALGLAFEGRVAEDFKLLSGTWVNVKEVRERVLSHFGPLVSDVVVAGPDRDDLSLLLFPSSKVDSLATDYIAAIRSVLSTINANITGSSRVIARAVIVQEPPLAEAGEVTEKGSLNSRLILQRRKAFIDSVYQGDHPAVILPQAEV